MNFIEYNFGTSGAIGHAAQQYIPVYGLLNHKNKAQALHEKGKISRTGKQSMLDQWTLNKIPLAGSIHAGITGHQFQELVKEEAKKIKDENPDISSKTAKRIAKKELYKLGKSKSKLFKKTDPGKGITRNSLEDIGRVIKHINKSLKAGMSSNEKG